MKTFDLNFAQGISLIIPGHFFPSSSSQIAVASPNGEVKILRWIDEKESWECNAEFDLSENGAIWNMIAADLTGEGLDDLIIGGMQGAVVCLSANGQQKWVYRFNSAISGLLPWYGISNSDKIELFKPPNLVIFSLDRTLRVIDHNGVLIWAQMFAGGVITAAIGDIDQDGHEEVIAGSNDGTLRIFDGSNGKIKWFHESGQTIRVLTIRDNLIIFGNDSKKIVLLDGMTHEVIKEHEFPCYPWQLKSIPDLKDRIYLSTYSFRYLGAEEDTGIPGLYCFHLPDLQLLWEKSLVNIQDLQLFYSITNLKRYGIWGTSDGDITLWDVDSGLHFEINELENSNNDLNSTVNSIKSIEFMYKNGTRSEMVVIGCDSPFLFYFELK